MSDTSSSHSRSSDSAAFWCLRIKSSRLTPAERAQFEEWLEQSVANRASFLKTVDVWEAFSADGNSASVLSMRIAALNDLRRRKSTAAVRTRLGEFRRLVIPRSRLRAMAVGMCLAVLGVSGTFYTLSAQATVYETLRGQTRLVQLPDGSILRMDAETRLKVRINSAQRKIWLERGRARVEIAPDGAHTLKIMVGNRIVSMRQGVLSVEQLGPRTTVVVIRGTADVAHESAGLLPIGHVESGSGAEAVLTSNQQLVSDDAQRQAAVSVADPNLDDIWQNGLLAFDNDPIAVAVARFNRYGSHTITVGRLNRAITISGIYRAGDAQAFVEGVASVTGLAYSEDGGTYEIFDPRQ